MHLDETVRIEDVTREKVKFKVNGMTLYKDKTRFTLRVGKNSTRLESDPA